MPGGGSVDAKRKVRHRGGVDQPLTVRQWEVALLVAQGQSTAEIGERLKMTRGSVRTMLSDIFVRLRIERGNRRVRLARWVWGLA